jgi:hypothetical protein
MGYKLEASVPTLAWVLIWHQGVIKELVMKHSMWKVALLVGAVMMTAVACNKKSADGASVSNGRDRVNVNANGMLPSGQGSTGTQSALITFSDSQKSAMRNAVQVLVAPTMPADSVGDINSVEVTGNVGFQSNGQVTNDSVIQLVIRDSYVGNVDGQTIDPITIRIRGATGSISNPQANMTFSDEYGTITVTGTWTAQTFTGTVSFVNRKAAENGDNKGTLGQFSIATCSFFRCM